MKFKIALAQMKIADSSTRNLKKIRSMTEQARKRGADLVVFPEIAASGNSEKLRDYDVNNRLRDAFAEMAADNYIDMVPGSVIVPSGRKFYNTSYYIDRKGRELARYNKQNLWISERSTMAQGSRTTVAKTRFGKIGLLICWDTILPELFRPMVKAGADMIIIPSYWWYGPDLRASPEMVKALITARSFECLTPIAYCNAAGRDSTGRKLLGLSQVVHPYDADRKILDNNKEGLLLADVNTSNVKKLEEDLSIKRGIMEL